MEILVTGGAGFIGSHLVDKLSNKHNVVVVDNFSLGSEKNLVDFSGVTLVSDVRNYNAMERVFRKYSFDAVIHCAAVVGVDRTKREPMNTITTEYDGTRFLLELSINNSVKKFINMSSSEVYGNSQLPMREDGPVNPNLDYGLAKLLSERMTKIFCDNSTMDTVSFRLFNVYGPRQREEFVVPIFIKNALDNKPLLLYGKDEMFRDFTYVSDVVDATEKALRVKCNGCVVNIASGIPTSIAELAHRVIELCNSKSRVITGKRRDGEIISRWASVLRASELLHFRAKTSLDTGLKKTIEWYRRE